MNYDRIILELLDRVSNLEDEIKIMKSKFTENEDDGDTETIYDEAEYSGGRDTTKYILDGKRLGKNRLVLAIVKKYMKEHPNTTTEELMAKFDKSLQGSLGVVRDLGEIKRTNPDYKRRFFINPNELIKTSTGTCVVCTQWGKINIGNMIARAMQLGYEITIVK